MITYKNVSYTTKTYHGVTFGPGEIHSVPNYINDLSMIIVPEELVAAEKKKAQKEQTQSATNSKSSKEENTDGENSNK